MFYLYVADKYLGNMLLSYGRTLSVSFTAELEELLPRSVTVMLEGSGILVSADLYSKQDPYSSLEKTPINTFTLRCVIHSHVARLLVFKLKCFISSFRHKTNILGLSSD